MKEKFNRIKGYAFRVMDVVSSHHTGAYAAQAAYFFVLSMIPIILLLLTMVQFTSLTKDYIMNAVLQAFPTTVEGLIDIIYSGSGVQPVWHNHSNYSSSGVMVSRERSTVDYKWTELRI